MWFIGVEVEQEMSAPPPKKNPGSAPARDMVWYTEDCVITRFHCGPNSVQNTPVRFGPNELPIRMPGQVNAPL